MIIFRLCTLFLAGAAFFGGINAASAWMVLLGLGAFCFGLFAENGKT